MWRDPTIKARFETVYSFAAHVADRLSQKYPSVVFVALVGAWARGVPSDEDIDFVIASTEHKDLGKIINDSKSSNLTPPFGLRTTFICYPFSTFREKVFSDRSRIPIIRLARIYRLIFRKIPLLKKTLLFMLGPHKAKLQKFEILPQTIQTYIPFFDRNGTLAQLQREQRNKLLPSFSESDILLYSQNGFYKLLDHYLSNALSKKEIRTTLLQSDIEWKEYMGRIIKMSDIQKKESLQALVEYVLTKN